MPPQHNISTSAANVQPKTFQNPNGLQINGPRMWGPQGLVHAAPPPTPPPEPKTTPVTVYQPEPSSISSFQPVSKSPKQKSDEQLRKERDARALFGGLVDDVSEDVEPKQEKQHVVDSSVDLLG